MHESLYKKVAVPGSSLTTGASGTLVVDRLGYDFCVIDVVLGTASATTAPTVLKVEESTDLTTYTAITALTGGTGFTIPATEGTTVPDGPYATFNIDCRARKRYLRLTCTVGAAATFAAAAQLDRPKDVPTTAATQNAQFVVNG
jgi:hypothetical protein